MANEELKALKLMASASFNGTAIGAVVESINGMDIVTWLRVKGQGKLGGKRGIVDRDCVVNLGMIGGSGPVAVDDTAGTLLITFNELDGTTTATASFATMKAGSKGLGFDANSMRAGQWSQEFVYHGDAATDPLTFTAN